MHDGPNDELFHIYKKGRVTVIGFDGRHLENPDSAAEIREGLLRLVSRDECEVLVVDLVDVGVVSSWVLGVLAAVRSGGVAVELYHPSADMRKVLDVTHLDDYLHVREGIS